MQPVQHLSASPTTDLDEARNDLDTLGYCLLANALSHDEISGLRKRLIRQAEAERALGYAFEDGGPKQQWGSFLNEDGSVRPEAFKKENGGVNQRVWMLVNKGQVFIDLFEKKDTLTLVSHVLGDEYLLSSHSANIANPGGVAMPLHTDQWWMPQPTRRDRRHLPIGSITRTTFDVDESRENDIAAIAPSACSNIIWMLDDFTTTNGATHVVPGSHLSGRHPDPDRDKLVEQIQACAPAGTALVTDGRIWHGTGANFGNTQRHAVLSTFCGPMFRPQENFVVGTRREVVDTASPSLLSLLGFKVWWGYGRTNHPTVKMIDRNELPHGILGEP